MATTPAPGDPAAGPEGLKLQGDLFRQEALAHHLSASEEGRLLRISPSWMTWTYWLLLVTLAAGGVILVLGKAPVYESGPAVLRVGGAVPMVSPVEGTIESIDAVPGQRLSEGQVVVRFRAEREKAHLQMIEGEFELQLLARLRNPADETSGRELRRLRPELERARAAVAQTLVRAPREGALQDVRFGPGAFLRAGDPLLSVVPIRPEYTVIAFLPGHALPQLAEGMPVRLRVTGYAYAYVSTSIQALGQQVIGPTEARRYLGPDIGDTVELTGPVVMVRCLLREGSFLASEREYRLYDGMRAEAAVAVRRERLIHRFIPGLRGLGARRG